MGGLPRDADSATRTRSNCLAGGPDDALGVWFAEQREGR
jgi:hypothetical protein